MANFTDICVDYQVLSQVDLLSYCRYVKWSIPNLYSISQTYNFTTEKRLKLFLFLTFIGPCIVTIL